MRWLLIVVAASGCSFDPTTTATTPTAEPDAQLAPALFCPDDPDLIGCYRFEGDIVDGSTYANDATAVGGSFDAGMDGMALYADTATEVTIPDDASIHFPPDQMTYEAWVYADAIPTTGRVGIVDQDGGPSIFIYADGDVQCFAGGRRIGTGTGAISAGAWTHVACAYLNDTTTIYVDGTPMLEQNGGGAITTGTIGISIAGNSPMGEPLEGRVDNLRVWRVARTQSQICDAAGC